MKVKVKELVLKIVSLLAMVLTFVGLALKFAYQKIAITGLPDSLPDVAKQSLPASNSLTRGDWTDSFKTLKDLNIKAVGWWQTARVFMIISLVIVAIVAVLSIVELFYNNKILSIAKKVLCVLGLVSVVVFLVTLLVGSGIIAGKISDIYTAQVSLGLSAFGLSGISVKASYIPHVGAFFIIIFAIVSLVSALLDRKKA